MITFGYLRDPLFQLAAIGYLANRFWLKNWLPSPFLHNYFDDLLLIPAALPPVLWIQRLARLRSADDMPSWAEMLFHLSVWAVTCEVYGPLCLRRGTADAWDVVAYGLGGCFALLWWNRRSLVCRFRLP